MSKGVISHEQSIAQHNITRSERCACCVRGGPAHRSAADPGGSADRLWLGVLASCHTFSCEYLSAPQVPTTAQVGVFEGTALIAGQRYHAGWLLLPGGDQRGAATYYPSSPVRGGIVIALLPEYPSSPI
jgi:hypothetical protein